MDYFAGLDISMDESHVCVLDREGVVVHQSKTASTAGAIAVELAESAKLSSHRIRDGRMAPIPFLGLNQPRATAIDRLPVDLFTRGVVASLVGHLGNDLVLRLYN